MSEEKKSRLIYILAASHSGSTLLASLLANHPLVCTVGELKLTSLGNVKEYRCSCREFIERCPFWLDINAAMLSHGFAFSVGNAGTDLRTNATSYVSRLLRPLHRGPVLERFRDVALALSPQWRTHLPHIQARNAALVACIAARANKPIVTDSSKIGLRLKYLLRNPALDVQVVRLTRDGRGVALTYTDPSRFADAQEPALRGGGTGGDRHNECLSFAEATWEWRRSNEEAEAVLANVSRERWIEVRYEDVCADPQATLEKIFRFVSIEPAPIHRPNGSAEHHMVGNGMRFDVQPQVQVDERWRSVLSRHELEVFDSIGGAINRRLGY